MTEYKLVVVGGIHLVTFSVCTRFYFRFEIKCSKVDFAFRSTAGGVGKSALTIQLIQNQ